jgi:WD40 repeat protein
MPRSFNLTLTAGAQFSADGSRVLFSSGAGGWALLWDVQESAWVGPLLGHSSFNFPAQISPDGKRLVAAQPPTDVHIYQASTARPVGKPIRSQAGLNGATFTPDSQRVFLSYNDGTARMHCADSGSPVGRVMTHEWGVTFVAFNPNGKRVCTATNQVRLWDVATGAAVSDWLDADIGSRHIGGHCRDPVFSPDGRVLCIAKGPRVRLLDAMTGQAIVRDLAHADDVHQTGFSSDGARLFTTTASGTVSFWDVMTGSRVSAPIKVSRYPYTCFADGGRRALTYQGFGVGVAQLWDVETSLPVGPPIEHPRRPDVSPDGKRIALISEDPLSEAGEALTLLDAETGDVIAISRPDQRGDRWAWSVMFSEDGRRLLVAGMSDEGSLWDGLTGAAIGSLKQAGEIIVAGFDPAGQRVVMLSGEGTARIWRADNGDPTVSPIEIAKRVAQSSRHLN